MVAATLSIAERQVARTLDLLEGGATIPFISRYRKEMTGGLDEVQIGEIKRVYDKLVETGKRKETILASIEAQDKLTDELKRRLVGTLRNWKTSICLINRNVVRVPR
mgnify:CR=1 FL=1